MVDELSKELARLGEEVYIITPYYEYNKRGQTNYLLKDNFTYSRNITVAASKYKYEFGIHSGTREGVNFLWFHNPELFSRAYEGEGSEYVLKQLVFFALASLQACCQFKTFPSTVVTNDWMCGLVSAYVRVGKFQAVFKGSKFIHILHNLDPLYMGRVYPSEDYNWLIQLPPEWYCEEQEHRLCINPSRCALSTCDNWGTVSHSYKYDLLRESPLNSLLWKHPHPFSFPNGVRKQQRIQLLADSTPGTHAAAKALIQRKYFGFAEARPDLPLLAFVGRITKQKGVHLILEAAEALLHENNFQLQILVGGPADAKEDYSRGCNHKMRELKLRFPQCFWSDPDSFFTDGPLINIGSDYGLMPSLFEPGGIVQHEFFCAGTPVIAFRTGGLKDTVFEGPKGNGFNFMAHTVEDFKSCVRRALHCFSHHESYSKLRENALESVVEEEDVAKGWNSEFYRLHNKIFIQWQKVELAKAVQTPEQSVALMDYCNGEYWTQEWEEIAKFKEILRDSSRLKGVSWKFKF